MRILRVRRGFTTNSSASSEWIPGQAPGTGFVSPSGTTIGSTNGGSTTPASSTQAEALKLGGMMTFVAIAFTAHRAARAVWNRKRKDGP